jgi:hypothetical protein
MTRRPTSEPYDVRLITMVPRTLKRMVNRAARRSYETTGAFVRRALAEQLQREVQRVPGSTARMEVMPVAPEMVTDAMQIAPDQMPVVRP